jgi:hypothetical protein
MHKLIPKQLVGRQVALLLLSVALVSSCAASNELQPLTPPVHITDKEFTDGIVHPVFLLLTTVSAYYVQERKTPGNQQALALYATKNGVPIDWHRLGRLEFSEDAEELVLRVLVLSPSSLSDASEISTSWRFSLNKTRSKANSLHFSVAPESRLCVQGQSGLPDSMTELFLEIAVNYLTKKPTPRETQFCFNPSTARSAPTNRKLEEKLEKLRRKQQLENPA